MSKQCLDTEEFMFWYWEVPLVRFIGPPEKPAGLYTPVPYYVLRRDYKSLGMGPYFKNSIENDIRWVVAMPWPLEPIQVSLAE